MTCEIAELKKIIASQKLEIFELKTIINNLPGDIYWKDKQGFYSGINITGYNSLCKMGFISENEDIIGKTDYDLYTKEMADEFRKNDLQVMVSKTETTEEESALLPSGETIVQISTKRPLWDEEGNITGIVGNTIDITKFKEIEARERQAFADAAAAKEYAKAEADLRQAVMVLAGSIAHDMRTPLAIVRMLGDLMGKLTPPLLQTYELAKQANLPNIPEIHPRQFQKLPEISENLGNIVTEMNEYINVTLKSLSQVVTKDLKPENLVRCSADYCISKLVSSYPFEDGEREMIHVNSIYQFDFMGNQILLFRVFSNLIKNSLYQIKQKGKGEIFISTHNNGNFNQIIIKDTAGGASPHVIATLFDGYSTTKAHGTGVGLAFCKLTMESFQGAISCGGVEGEYIEFILSFPAIEF